MKFTLSWLKAHLDTDADLATIERTLSAIGLEVEGIEDRGAALASFRIAHVVEAEQHPNADRLRALKVDPGDGNLLSVVCGAPNARAGMKGVVALPGAFIPGTGITLKKGEIRGVASEAMMLSAREMGLGDDHSGIVDLPADAPLGQPYANWAGLDDPVIEIAVTPNRGDALSVRGVARDLAAAGIGTLKPWAAEPVPASFASPLRWAIADAAACPYVIGRTIRGLRNGPSPRWLQDRLTAIGLRPINALVDITNLFTVDLGRPSHVFDARKVAGDTLTMRCGDGASFRALNGKEYAPGAEDLVIADASGPHSLAGIIGGEDSGCDETTTDAFIEVAIFDPVRVALSGRRHGIHTDARARFERGIDPALMHPALEAITRLMLELCGGAASEIVTAGTPPAWQRDATLRFDRLRSYGGAEVAPAEAVSILERLGFATRAQDGERVTVAVPSWRNDIAAPIVLEQAPGLPEERARIAAEGCAAIEAECDLIEEVLRIRGLDQVPAVSLPREAAVPGAVLTPRQTRTALAKRVLAGRGFAECVTFSFLEKSKAALFGAVPDTLTVENPIASDLDQMRPTPLACLAQAASRNAARGYADLALAEIGPGWLDPTPEGQKVIAAGLRTGSSPRSWITPTRGTDLMDAKADVWALLAALGVPLDSLSVTADAPAHYHPGRSGVVRQGPKTVLATFGELHPRVISALDLSGPASAFEVMLDAIADPRRRKRAAPDLPAFQPLRRDFAFIVDRDVNADAVLRAARGAERTLITGVSLFDVYEGDRIEADRKSLGIEVTLQPRERTLTDAEIEAVAAKIVAAVVKATGATLRG